MRPFAYCYATTMPARRQSGTRGVAWQWFGVRVRSHHRRRRFFVVVACLLLGPSRPCLLARSRVSRNEWNGMSSSSSQLRRLGRNLDLVDPGHLRAHEFVQPLQGLAQLRVGVRWQLPCSGARGTQPSTCAHAGARTWYRR